MRVLICPDAFKGTMTAREASEAIERGVKEASPGADTVKVPMADGGSGTLDVIMENAECEVVDKVVRGPIGRPVRSRYLMMRDGSAFIEMAQAAGLILLGEEDIDPALTTTYGVGELILDALGRGCRDISVGVGGSATNDGGMGMAQALGFRFLDDEGREVGFRKREGYSGGSLEFVRKIDPSGADPLTRGCRITIASDVDNPLTGPRGASRVYGPQKGATPRVANRLDEWMEAYSEVIGRDLGVDVSRAEGAGAAGGLGAGLMAFLGARLVRGIDVVIDMVGLDDHVRSCDLVVTGEGRVDFQTAHGKTINGIAVLAKKHGVPVIAMAGCLGERHEEALGLGIIIHDVSGGRRIGIERLKKDGASMLERAASEAMRKHASTKAGPGVDERDRQRSGE